MLSRSTICLSTSGTPMLATLAPIRQASAAITRHLYTHKYGIRVPITAQSLRLALGSVEGGGEALEEELADERRMTGFLYLWFNLGRL